MTFSLKSKLFDGMARRLSTPSFRRRVGRHLLDEARGEGNDNSFTNGEYRFLDQVKERFGSGSAPIFFDVGANVGEWSRRAAEGLSALTLFAFEPTPGTYRVLEAGRARDPRVVMHCEPMCLGNENGFATLFEGDSLAGTNSVHRRSFHNGQKIRVAIKTGDAFCEERKIKRIDFLKIDTEGHEMAVLKGFESMLTGGRIAVLQFEYGGTWIDARAYLKDAFDFLLPRDYRVGRLHPRGIEWISSYHEQEETFRHANYVALRRGTPFSPQ